jgi:hypothetical protein
VEFKLAFGIEIHTFGTKIIGKLTLFKTNIDNFGMGGRRSYSDNSGGHSM